MFVWIFENIATIVLSILLILTVAAILANMVQKKKKGKSSCGCGCQSCAMNSSCHKQR